MWVDVDTAITVPVNLLGLTDATDFKTRETAIAYNQAGMDLVWNFQTTAGVTTQTAVTPTTAGVYDWTHSGGAMYKIEIPASGGVSINNDTEGTGWFSGICTGVLHWRGPEIHFRAAALNNALIDGGDTLDVNVTTVADTVQTANDNGADVNTILSRIIGTLASGTHNAQSGDGYARLGAPAGVSIAADLVVIDNFVDELETRLTAVRAAYLDVAISSRNSVVPDAAGVAPTAVQIRQEIDTNSTKSGYALSAIGLDLILFDSVFLLAAAKAVWTDTLTAYTNGMAGKRLKGLSAATVVEGTVNDASATTLSFISDLTGYGTNFFVDTEIAVEIAADQWQPRVITAYNTTTGAMTVDEAFISAPPNTAKIALTMRHIHSISSINAEMDTAISDANLSTDINALITTIGTAGAGLSDLGGMSTAMKAEILAEVVKLLTTQMAESYAADGVVPTMTQSLMLIQQALTEFAIVGVALNIFKLDGTTTAAILTLDSASSPTAAARTT